MIWTIKFAESIKKDLKGVSILDRERIKEKINWLAQTENPNQHGKKLTGKQYKDLFRLCVGNYRIIYKTENQQLVIIVLKIGHRKDIYNEK